LTEARESRIETPPARLVLASASPRRAELLRQAGLAFDVLPVEVDETPLPGESARQMVRRLAQEKARLAATRLEASRPGNAVLILAADTTVVLDGEILGKPADAEDARRMLRQLSGRTHEVITGIALLGLPGGTLRLADEATLVTFAQISDAEIETYVATGEPVDKAGAYAIQGGAARFVTRLEGSYSNVVGLPVELVKRMLEENRGQVVGDR
jgi:septum formation protein